MRRLLIVLLLAGLTFLTACTTVNGVKPVYPPIGDPRSPTRVDSLQPTMKWEPAPGEGLTYDLIIYEVLEKSDFWKGREETLGKEAYYREGIQGTEHKLEEPLKPDFLYAWALRTRKDGHVSAWSRYNYFLFLGVAWMHYQNQLYRFKTPEK